MNNSRILYPFLSLMTLIIIGTIASIPDFIPSWEIVQFIFILIIYLLIIALAYILIQRLQVYFSEKYSINKSILYAKIASMTIILCLFISFILTSINIGEGIFKGKFIKEMYFPAHHIRLYIYDYSFSNSLTSIKVKDRTWPVMEKLSFIENSSPFELKIWRHSDTVVFTGKDIKLIYDLRQRKGKKIYYKQSSDNKARL